MTPFQTAIKFVLQHEGGYSLDPVDPGGETNYGISKRSYPNIDIKNLTIAGAMEIYNKDYWIANNLDADELPLCIVLLDSYVQHGKKMTDIMFGNSDETWEDMIRQRRQFYLDLIARKPAMQKYKNGWMNRLNDLSKYCQIVMQEQQ